MAVIKIVPMPGAVGDKGDEGAVGPQGPQGATGEQGPSGADALWSYNGPWQSNASYAEGDVVTYQGQLYYTKSVAVAGTLPTDTSKFDLLAAKGADGEPGLNGLEGEPGPQGEPGADGETPFTIVGEYNNGTSYGLKEAVYYNGGTYVRTGNPLNPGYPPEVGAVNASWTPLAEKGADSTQLNFWNFTGDPGVPTEDGAIVVDGISGRTGGNAVVFAESGGSVILAGTSGEFLNDSNIPSNQIATIGDIATAQNSSFAEVQYTVSGGALGTQPTFDGAPLFAGSYTKTGNLVHFRVNVNMSNITNFGSGQYYVSIPFTSEYDVYVRNGQLKHSSGDMYSVSGHATAGSNELRLYTTASNGKEVAFTSSSPVGLNTTCDFHIFGSYFSTPNA